MQIISYLFIFFCIILMRLLLLLFFPFWSSFFWDKRLKDPLGFQLLSNLSKWPLVGVFVFIIFFGDSETKSNKIKPNKKLKCLSLQQLWAEKRGSLPPKTAYNPFQGAAEYCTSKAGTVSFGADKCFECKQNREDNRGSHSRKFHISKDIR